MSSVIFLYDLANIGEFEHLSTCVLVVGIAFRYNVRGTVYFGISDSRGLWHHPKIQAFVN